MENLREFHLSEDPFSSFESWYLSAQKVEPNAEAMSLATIDKNGFPYNRTVLYKGMLDKKIIFYTNYMSLKGHQLEQNPQVSLLFYWVNEFRQIRVNGKVEKMSREKSIEYFQSRDRDSQIASYISKQSQKISSRYELMKLFEKTSKEFENGPIPTPDHWGGFLVTPVEFEFFIYGKNRLNDRFLYELENNVWSYSRLQP